MNEDMVEAIFDWILHLEISSHENRGVGGWNDIAMSAISLSRQVGHPYCLRLWLESLCQGPV